MSLLEKYSGLLLYSFSIHSRSRKETLHGAHWAVKLQRGNSCRTKIIRIEAMPNPGYPKTY
jgi:hypothetical protein